MTGLTVVDKEAKRESGDFNGLDEFDCENFMDALRREILFGPVAQDDVNVSDGSASDDEQRPRR
ncbi:hypothetical protein PC128_g4120 [Phytophthora cactorum]|nr:hypothetical protein PC120_g25697 [Phytophthora cactorum]KAG3201090.1 hypothetical protein PC128_g4120 [Phytophthora cactorum]KAG4048287.1 hypothetical protein PC123_g16392 [Phytophthora cactorum]